MPLTRILTEETPGFRKLAEKNGVVLYKFDRNLDRGPDGLRPAEMPPLQTHYGVQYTTGGVRRVEAFQFRDAAAVARRCFARLSVIDG